MREKAVDTRENQRHPHKGPQFCESAAPIEVDTHVVGQEDVDERGNQRGVAIKCSATPEIESDARRDYGNRGRYPKLMPPVRIISEEDS